MEKLIQILTAANVHNEDGEQMTDFTPRNTDSQDFGTVSRWQLEEMLTAAYKAGQQSK